MEGYDGTPAYINDRSDAPKLAPRHADAERPVSVGIYKAVKRGLDVALSLAALTALGPVFLAAGAFILLEDGGPVFYISQRMGRDGRGISVLKFRSMKPGSHCLEETLTREELMEYRREYKLARDPRLTRVGAFLRKTSIDELPQLLNILKGDMSLVGPRPLVREELEGKYLPAQQELLLSVRPGLTGLWQVNGRSDCTYESGRRQKTELSYIRNHSFVLDMKILLRTVAVVARRIGAR